MEPENTWTTLLRKFMLLFSLVCLVDGSSRNPDMRNFHACEGQEKPLSCPDNTLISIQTAVYGLRTGAAHTCLSLYQQAPAEECLADSDIVLQTLQDLCHRKSRCDVMANDNLFRLGQSKLCPDQHTIQSQLNFQYQCRPLSMWSTTTTVASTVTTQSVITVPTTIAPPLTTVITVPSSTTLSTVQECQQGETKAQDCYSWSCNQNGWQQTSVDQTDAQCCHLWDGCDRFKSANVSSAGSLAKCPADNSTDPAPLSWPEAAANSTIAVKCPGDTRQPAAYARRKCNENGTWEEFVNFSPCPSDQLLELLKKDLHTENLRNFTKDLASVTSEGNLISGDIPAVARLINDVTDSIPDRTSVSGEDIVAITKNVLETGDNVLSTKKNRIWSEIENTEKSHKAMEVVGALESMARQAASVVTTDLSLQTESIKMDVKVVEGEVISDNATLNIESKSGSIRFPVKNFLDPSAPKPDLVNKLVTVFYDTNKEIWSKKENQVLNTPVFSASVVDSQSVNVRRQLQTPFTYTLRQRNASQQQSSNLEYSCVFWDDQSPTGGYWSTEGCRQLENKNSGYFTCECDHMTNFAVLLDVTGMTNKISESHELSLRIITYAGCAISIVCLLLSLLTFQFLKNLSSDRNTIHKHLVFTLLLAESLFLVAISPSVVQIKVFCSVVAGLLHYLFLAVFAWTCLEGVQLYIMLIEVFEAERSRTLYYYISGYGIPAIIVGVSAAVRHQGYGTPTVCWLGLDHGFIWSFAGPIAVVMAVNLVMLGIALYMMYNHARMVANMKHKETTKMDSIKAWVKGAIVLVVLLGLTWVFGFLYISWDTLVMAYLFTILNSLQGLFIFIFHCFGNEKVQKEYKKLVRRTQWLPNCIRVHYGEHRGLSYATSNSSSSHNYLSRYFGRRKSSDLNTSLRGKKPVGPISSNNSNGNNSFDDSNAGKEPLTPQYKDSITSQHSKSYDESVEPLTPVHGYHQPSPC